MMNQRVIHQVKMAEFFKQLPSQQKIVLNFCFFSKLVTTKKYSSDDLIGLERQTQLYILKVLIHAFT